MEDRRGGWFGRLSIKVKLGMLFAVVSIIPVMVVGLISLGTFSQSMMEKGVQDSLNRLDFLDYRMVEIIREKHADTLAIAFSPYVRVYFDQDSDSPLRTSVTLENLTRRQVISLHNSQEDASVALIAGDGRALCYGSVHSSAVQETVLTPPDLESADFRLFDRWCDATQEGGVTVVPYERLVLGTDNQPVAILRMNVRESLLRSLYREYEQDGVRGFYIVNQRGVVQSATDREAVGKPLAASLGLDLEALQGDRGYMEMGDSVITCIHNSARGLYFLEDAPRDQYRAGFSSILQSILLVSLLCVVVCVTLGSLLSRSFTKPLYRLIDRVRRIDGQSASARAGRNEIAILSDKYGQIVSRLETLIADYYQEQQKKKEAQIRALEFQINPHFLYNTLSTIVWLIEAGQGRDAIRVTKDLSAFFRISISKGKEYIPLGEELRHVALYLDIQKARYADSIAYSCEVPENMLAYYMPKLLLQPLVENCIIHAMQARPDKRCRIRVLGRMEEDAMILEVRDNGTTVTRETLTAMNDFLRGRASPGAQRHWGIGIANVNDRVRMCFGEGYGLSYRREGEETVATVRLRTMGEAQRDG